jgi:16S rRNA (uracil1498-N3)-methyltransferase
MPELRGVMRPGQAFGETGAGDSVAQVMLSERIGAPSLRSVLTLSLAPPKRAVLAIGPEGGWTEEEFETALAAEFQEASLGKLILRTETAVIAALATLNYAFGG